jgi:hypothetical protein
MFDQTDNETGHLLQVNSDLRASLKRCRVLLDECRSKLAANSNEPECMNTEEAQGLAAAD